MKKIYSVVVFALTILLSTTLQAQNLDLPQPSPWAQVSQTIGLTTLSVTYSRPSVKGRKIFGNIVPYNTVWRTGANACTQITFSGDVTINNTTVAAGTYALFTIPGESEWTIIVNKDADQWGAYNYKQENDIVRFTVKPATNSFTETFTINFANITSKSAVVELYWENTKVNFTINADYIEQAKMNIDNALKDIDNAFNTYNDVAEFYIANNLDAKKALEYAKKSTDANQKYWNMNTLSQAYAANNMYKEAIEAGNKALELAKAADNAGEQQIIEKNIEAWKKM